MMQSAIDYSFIQSICDGDNAFLKEMLESILQSLPEYFANYKLGLLEQNQALAKAECHKIKPLFGYLLQDEFYQKLHALQEEKEVARIRPLIDDYALQVQAFLSNIQEKIKEIG